VCLGYAVVCEEGCAAFWGAGEEDLGKVRADFRGPRCHEEEIEAGSTF